MRVWRRDYEGACVPLSDPSRPTDNQWAKDRPTMLSKIFSEFVENTDD